MSSLDRARQLDLTTKARLASGLGSWHTEAAPEIGLESLLMTDGPHGIRYEPDDVAGRTLDGSPATCFPPAVSLASTFDVELVRDVGAAIAREARSLDVGAVLGPGLNIKRHPRCGRNFEYLSEDPYVSGVMAAALVDGIQSLGVGATLKHFAANNQETMRLVIDEVIDERTLREIYLAGFEHAVRTSAPWAVMTSYNLINGEYCSESRRLLTEILRDEWGFDGLVMTDWGAANDRAAGIAAGCDLEMPGNKGLNDPAIIDAVAAGRLDEADLDLSIARLIELVDRAAAGRSTPVTAVDQDAQHALARRAAAAGCVLLTNDGTLPLTSPASVAVIGEFADNPRFQGAGSSQITATRVDRPLDELTAALGDASVRYAPGYRLDGGGGTDPDERAGLIDEAALTASRADVAVVFVGLPDGDEAETFDRDHLRLPRAHDELVRAVCAANERTVVVLFNGSSVTMPWVDQPAAIVEAHLGGQAVGGAVADVLTGVVNPSGRLAETVPVLASDHGSDAWFPGEGRRVEYREGLYVGYRWFDSAGVEPLFCFGHGLSYTTFEYSDLHRDDHTVAFRVTNTGDRAGAEVCQVYVRKQGGVVHAPFQALRGFRKVFLEPGESADVRIDLDVRSFQYYDTSRRDWAIDPATYEIAVGASSRDVRGTIAVDIGTDTAGEAPEATAADTALATVSAAAIADDATFEALLGGAIPPPAERTRFDRNSTFGELAEHPAGWALHRAAVAAAKQQFKAKDPATANLVERAVAEMPLRAFAQVGEGKLRWEVIDRTLAVLNATDGAFAKLKSKLHP